MDGIFGRSECPIEYRTITCKLQKFIPLVQLLQYVLKLNEKKYKNVKSETMAYFTYVWNLCWFLMKKKKQPVVWTFQFYIY